MRAKQLCKAGPAPLVVGYSAGRLRGGAVDPTPQFPVTALARGAAQPTPACQLVAEAAAALQAPRWLHGRRPAKPSWNGPRPHTAAFPGWAMEPPEWFHHRQYPQTGNILAYSARVYVLGPVSGPGRW